MNAQAQQEHVPAAGHPRDLSDAVRLELVLRATNEGLWEWDVVTDEVHYSPRWKEMLGYADDELPDRFEEWERRVHPDDLTTTLAALHAYMAGESSQFEVEYRLRHKDGSYRWICARGVVAHDAAGHPVRLVGSNADITERKRVATDLLQRETIFAAVTFAAERLLRTTHWEEAVDEVLARLGHAADVSRVYIFENYIGPDGAVWASQRCEWTRQEIPARIDDPYLNALPYQAAGLGRWMDLLGRGELLFGHVRELPETMHLEPGEAGFQSLVLVPIFVDGEWWGNIGFDECTREREFSALERDALRAAADTLGAAIGRHRANQTATRLAAIVESSEDAIISMGLDGVITSWNSGAERLYGYRPDEAINQSIAILLPPDALATMPEALANLKQGERIDPYETERIRKDGTRVAVSVAYSPVRDAHGTLIGTSSIYRDISAQKQAEVAIREREAQTAAIVAAALDCIVVIDGDGMITEFNPAAEQTFGYCRDEILGQELAATVIPPAERDRHRRGLARYLTTGEGPLLNHRIEVTAMHADGKEFPAELAIAPVSLNGAPAFIGYLRDITERQQAEVALRQSRQSYRDLVHAIDGIVWEAEADTVRFTFVSDQAERLLGYPTARWLAEPNFWQDHMHPDDRGWTSSFCATATAEKRDHEFEYRMIAADGRTVWLRDIVTVVIENGRVTKLRGVMVDITPRKRHEQDLLRRDAILQAVRFAGERFLTSTTTWEEGVPQVLEQLGRASDVSRVYVFEKYRGADGALWATQRFEWVAPGIAPQIDDPRLGAISLEAAGLARWTNALSRGELLHGHVRELPGIERVPVEAGGPLSLVLVPIFVDGAWWGVIGFDECTRERDFSAMERDALKAAADTLGAAIGRDRANLDLKSERDFSSTVLDTVGALVAVMDRQGRIIRFNRACEQLTGYTADEVKGQTFWELFLIPEEVDEVRSMMGKVAAGHFPYAHENVWVMRDGSHRLIAWNNTAILDEQGEPTFLIKTGIDITERRRAEEARRESQRMLSTLLSNLPGMVYRCRNDPSRTMEFVSDGCLDLTGYPPSDLLGNHRLGYADLVHPDDRAEDWGDVQTAILTDEPFRFTYRITTATGTEKWVLEQGRGVRGHDGAVLAIEGFITDVTDRVQARLLLEQRVATLTELASSLTVDQPMETTLCNLAASIAEASGAVACIIGLVDADRLGLRLLATHGMPEGAASALEASWPVLSQGPEPSTTARALQNRQPILARDLRRRDLSDQQHLPTFPIARDAPWDFLLSLPLVYQGEGRGVINLYFLPEREPSADEITFLSSVADQVAIAVENSHLYEQAQGTAALEERQRLARELHDSVSQALYGIGLGAAAVRSWLDTDPSQAIEPADYVLSLAEAGLAEMRALIFELRPESLAEEGLVAALEKQAASLRARYDLVVDADLGTEPETPLAVKETLYRIAQEALHNTVKHARANRVALRLEHRREEISLEITDDGIGFDPSGRFPGHLGLRSMRERVTRHGGDLVVESAPGQGVRIRVRVPQVQ